MRSAIMLTMGLILCYKVGAQDTLHISDPKLTLKVDIANLVNPMDKTLLLSLEYFFNPNWSLTQEAGMVTAIRDYEMAGTFRGFKIKEEVRRYLRLDRVSMYTGLSLFYRNLNMTDQVQLGYNCFGQLNTSCDYIRFTALEITNHQVGGTFKIGLFKNLNSRLWIETDVGVGLQQVIIDQSDQEGQIVNYNFNNYYGDGAAGSRGYASVQAKLGYKIISR